MTKKGMNINFSYNDKFVTLLNNLKEKYGQIVFDLSGIGKQLDINYMSKQFYNTTTTTADVSVDANANVGSLSIIAYDVEVPKPYLLLNSYYRLWKELSKNRSVEFANSIIEKQISGEIYINDFTGWSASKGYCFNYSTYDTALNGIPKELDPKGVSYPPKFLYSFKSQLELFCLIAGNSTVGATGIADALIVISMYFDQILRTKKDAHVNFKTEEDCWTYLRETLTSFIYTLNQPFRTNQSLFSNISIFDDNFLNELCPTYNLELSGVMYTANPELVKKIQVLFLNIMNKELSRRGLTFPVTTACFSIDDDYKILDKNFRRLIAEQNLNFGFINLYSGKTSTLSSCCRLRSDMVGEYFNTFGAGSTKVGSIGVATGNLPRIAFTSKDKEEFLTKLTQIIVDCQEVNNAKRNIIKRSIKNGSSPLYTLGYMDVKKQYSSFGINGLYEALEILGYDILTQEGQDFVLEIMDLINTTNADLQKRFKYPHNVEQIPAESVAVKIAQKDRVLGYNKEYELYSNQFIPLIHEANLLDRIKLQGLFDKHFSGGAICHLNMDQQIKDVESMEALIESAANKGVVYFAINYVLQECSEGHFSVGQGGKCPICNSEIVDYYTRPVGFLTKVRNWNKTRREFEFGKRQFYKNIEVDN